MRQRTILRRSLKLRRRLIGEALAPLASNPDLRNAIVDVRKSYEQTIDEVSKDTVLFAGHSEEGREKAAAMVASFKEYIEEHKDDIRALQILYSRPYHERLTFAEIKELAQGNRTTATAVDAREALASLRAARPIQGPRIRAADAHRHCVAGAVYPRSGR